MLDPLRNWIDDLLPGLGYSVTLGDDRIKPACIIISCTIHKKCVLPYIELVLVHVLELNRRRILSGFSIIDIADAVCGKINMSVLVAGDLEFPKAEISNYRTPGVRYVWSSLV